MSQKIEKPSLTGHRIKTRKRDEKEKYDPSAFRDAIVQGLNEASSDIDQISKFLDSTGSKLDYRRYSESLLDILFAGGILAPGGSILQDSTEKSNNIYNRLFTINLIASIFSSSNNLIQILYKLIRRYKYLEKSFDDELKKLILFLKGFSIEEREKLAKVIGICLSNGLGSPASLLPLFDAHLVKDGLSLEFAQHMFHAWLREKDIQNVGNALKKSGIESRLLELLPINKRSQENFESAFNTPGLEPIIEFQRVKASAEMKKGVQSKLEEMLKNEEPIKDMIALIKEHMSKTGMQDHETIVMVWNTLMNAVEWNKKDDLVGDQAIRHLKQYSSLLASLTETNKSQLTLLHKIQEYCYDNMNFIKVFSKIVILFYKADVLDEDAILKWYNHSHSAKGKTIFLEQMKNFIHWLQSAEEG
ncbi:hypothetical protein HELRODRAFT_82136 [Helobdella robusta]|uniref:W2 domain-containing protein n=1 Tax=Helobdella robusta TaxID=6412 RepID=T1G4N4_HELRO|nr:hypothetical protein HELRODRAFT_82136 [Helobdella robusta]ESO01408.1 hypothetical protein HELRODRAFT_82136 [Helobdella robusta]